MLIDTHCHIHDLDYPLDPEEVITRAHEQGVDEIICIGTDIENSKHVIEFANSHDNVYATIGVHPHDATIETSEISSAMDLLCRENLNHLSSDSSQQHIFSERLRAGSDKGCRCSKQNSCSENRKLVAIGEIGLDYFRSPTPREKQIEIFRAQIEIAIKYDLPVVFHVRDAYEDFWRILDDYPNVHGVLHCFSDSRANAEEALKRGLYISVNGISTFTKDAAQKQLFIDLPIDKIFFETDAPYLTPAPFRGKINEPAFVRTVAEFHSEARHMSIDEIASITTANAHALFRI